jgi:hypothetical protein
METVLALWCYDSFCVLSQKLEFVSATAKWCAGFLVAALWHNHT